jgi:hypothetical protein
MSKTSDSQKRATAKWAKKNKDKIRQYQSRWNHSKHGREYRRKYSKNWAKENPLRTLFSVLQTRSRERGYEFNLTFEELTQLAIPNTCPILGIPISWDKGSGNASDSSISIDRIDPSRGYTGDNIIFVSLRANRIKNDGTLDEFRKIVVFLENVMDA